MPREKPAKDVKKLPKWARDHIARLEAERDNAARKLTEFLAEQGETAFFSDEHVSDGVNKSIRRYFNVWSMKCKAGEAFIKVVADEDEGIIKIYFGSGDSGMRSALLRPIACNAIEIVPDKDG